MQLLPILFTNLGYTPENALAPVLKGREYRKVYVFHGTPAESEAHQAIREAKAILTKHGVEFEFVEVSDPFDYLQFIHAYRENFGDYADEEPEFCASGGTRVMTMAMSIFTFTTGKKLLYYDEFGAKEGKIIPLQAMRHLENLGPNPREILRFLQSGPKDMGEISEYLDLAPSTITVHVRRLIDAEAVLIEKDGKHRIVHIQEDLKYLPIL